MRAQLLITLLLGLIATGTAAQASVEISSQPTQNIICTTSRGSTCVATADDANLNVNALANMLSLSNVKITAGQRAISIRIAAALTWTSTKRLSLDSGQSVDIASPVVVAGTGGLSIFTKKGGNLSFLGSGSVKFWDTNSTLSINSNQYVLVASISTLAGDVSSNPSGNFALANDYNANGEKHFASPILDQFRGRYEGLGNTISNVRVKDHTNFSVGFFSNLGSMSEVENLKLIDVNIEAGRSGGCAAGALVGSSVAIIRNVVTSGKITATECGAGGLAGASSGSIEYSSSTCVVVSGQAGGLVGFDNGSITDSHASGTVSGPASAYIGGLVGFASADSISRSFATGTATAKGQSNVGGLVGRHAGGHIENSYAFGSVTGLGSASVGGLVGFVGTDELVTLKASYSTGAVSSGGDEGGFVGYDSGGNLENTYWDLDTSGVNNPSRGAGNIPNDPGITGLRDTQLKSGLPAGFDSAVWAQSPNINNGYPYLIANPPPQ